MLSIGGGFFLQLPDDSKQHILHPGKVVGLEGNTYTAELEEQGLDIEEGQDLIISFSAVRDFLQQAARILKILGDEPTPTIEFETIGEPASAESRQYYRVSTVAAGLTAELAGEDQCPLLDVSWTGFSVISSRNYAIGSIIEAALIHQGAEYRGKVSVQSVRELSKGRICYGLCCVGNEASTGNLPQGLQLITRSFLLTNPMHPRLPICRTLDELRLPCPDCDQACSSPESSRRQPVSADHPYRRLQIAG